MNGTVVYKFLVLAVLKEYEIIGNICFSEQIFYRKQSPSYPVTPIYVPLVAFKKTHPRIYIFSKFTMFVKQILKDSLMNLKNCISSHFLCYSPVREFIAIKVRLSSLFGYSHCSKSLKTILPITMHR